MPESLNSALQRAESEKPVTEGLEREMRMEEKWAGWGSALASAMFLWAVVRQYFSTIFGDSLGAYAAKLVALVYPYIEITFFEYTGERLKRSEAYAAVESYLAASGSTHARRLKADNDREDSGSALVLSMDDHEEVTDTFSGAKLYWSSQIIHSKSPSFSFYPSQPDRRYYRLSFHRRHRDLIAKSYLRHVLDEGKIIGLKNRRRRLYTNNSTYDSYDYRKRGWSHVPFEHPANFDTIAMDAEKKREIMEDLIAFSRGKEFYLRIGKPWKRGYLLHGPPGTGKSTMIAAMANLLDYDVYDLELTAVKNNSALRKLLLEISSKSIIVIEDIDCSIDLSGKRKKESQKSEEEKKLGGEENTDSKVTLSGLLNFIDGLWSACGGERLVVFTTNFVEKLDPALIRRGRMDRHIELSYCDFQVFRVLARNYLGIENHTLFDEIRCLIEERNITPADVAENLMPKKITEVAGSVEVCLRSLIQDLLASKLKSAKGGDEMMETPAAAEENYGDDKEKESASSST
ncbi:Calmodulin-interacting protein 111 [Platanthera zijinensis]|uniref:Calmodulin-interacting protein 111 n=1 Tax=Platanthera zijinensis TaxID=2320716 RepID=A0AAP0GAV9_9ASPA